MKTRRIVLIDVGLDAAFDASMQFAQGLLGSINAGVDPNGPPEVEVDFVRSRDQDTAFSTMTTKCSVLHVMAHGDAGADPRFVSSSGEVDVNMTALADWATEYGRGIRSAAIIADGCRTGTGIWQRAIRNCLQGPVTYIGTTRNVGWFDGTVFSSAFYAALLRNRGKSVSPSAQAEEAATRAAEAFSGLTGRPCPYRSMELVPSRSAKRAFV